MIGVGKALMIETVAVEAPYSVNLNPGRIIKFSFNGSGTSPRVYSTVINGIGPFTYLWTITGDDILINSPENESTTFGASGYNTEYNETATLTVTDTGNSDEETTEEISISFAFEN